MSPIPDLAEPIPLRSRLASKLIIPLTAVCLACLAVWSIISPNFLENQYTQLPPDPYGLSHSERLDLAQTAVTYLRLGAPPETVIYLLAEQTLPNGTPLYTQAELHHLVDVKHLTDAMRIVGLACLGLLFMCVLFLMPPRPRFYALRQTAVGGFLLMLLTFILLLFASLLWPLFFGQFHELLFAAGTWTFAETAGLIRLFPEVFWFRVGQSILTRLLLAGLATFLLSAAAFLFCLKREHVPKDDDKKAVTSRSWTANYTHEKRWLKLGLLTIIPNALMWYLLGYAFHHFSFSPIISGGAFVVAILMTLATATAFDNTHHQPLPHYGPLELNEYMISLFGLGAVFLGVGLLSFGLRSLPALLAPGMVVSGLYILILGSGQLMAEYLSRQSRVLPPGQ